MQGRIDEQLGVPFERAAAADPVPVAQQEEIARSAYQRSNGYVVEYVT